METDLLLSCAGLEQTLQKRARVANALAGGLDWRHLLAIANRNGLSPLLFRNLQLADDSIVPKQVFAELWSRHRLLQRHNKEMLDELTTILRVFESCGIAAIPYKGPMLALQVYGDLALREFSDLDLLLKPVDILRAKEALHSIGYEPEFVLTPAVEGQLLRAHAHYHLMLSCESRNMLVELHWKTDAEFPVERSDDAKWWAGLGTTRLGDAEVRCFAPRELLLVLCLHGSKHHWASLGWLVDVAELIRQQPELDWSWILARAEALHAGRRLALGLHLLRRMLDVPLPEPVLSWLIAQPQAERIAVAIEAGLFDLSIPERNAFQRLRLNLRLYETLPQRVQHIADVVCRPSLVEWSRWPLPRPLFFLYPLLRLLNLTEKYALKLVGR